MSEISVAIEIKSFECFNYILSNKLNSFDTIVEYCIFYNNLEYFEFCFEKCNDTQAFWNMNFDLDKFIDRIQIDLSSI